MRYVLSQSFFCLDSETILNMDGVEFSEVSCAGYKNLELCSGVDAFSKLPFEKIFHDGSFSADERDDIIRHRHAEVVRPGGIPIRESIRAIACRTTAERQTLLFLLRSNYSQKTYDTYQPLIKYIPNMEFFFNNGIFVRHVEYLEDKVKIFFNDCVQRYGRSLPGECGVSFVAKVHHVSRRGEILDCVAYTSEIDYSIGNGIILTIDDSRWKYVLIEIYIDEILMYKNLLDNSKESWL